MAGVRLWKTDKKKTADLYKLYFFRKQNESTQVLSSRLIPTASFT